MGGLALAAFGLHELGDVEAARALVAEELARPGADRLPAILPRLETFLESGGAVRT